MGMGFPNPIPFTWPTPASLCNQAFQSNNIGLVALIHIRAIKSAMQMEWIGNCVSVEEHNPLSLQLSHLVIIFYTMTSMTQRFEYRPWTSHPSLWFNVWSVEGEFRFHLWDPIDDLATILFYKTCTTTVLSKPRRTLLSTMNDPNVAQLWMQDIKFK